jgi:hypothetical protein
VKRKTTFELAEEVGSRDKSAVARVLRGECAPGIIGKWEAAGIGSHLPRVLRGELAPEGLGLETPLVTEQAKPRKADDGHQDKCTCKGCMASRAKVRSAWLDKKLETRGWTRNVLSRQENAPTYNTIRAYCEGRKTRQAIQIRFGIAKALSVEISEVPE